MSVSEGDRQLVDDVFRVMQSGPDGAGEMLSLFSDDAVFIEPFSGTPRTHHGKDEIRDAFLDMERDPVPDLKLVMDRLDLDGEQLRAEWTCTAPVFPAPMKGYDLFTIRAGKIARLEVVVTDAPPMG